MKMDVANWLRSNPFALIGSESPSSSAKQEWLWQNSSSLHTDGPTLWREPVEIYLKRQRIFLSLGSVLLLLRTYAKEMIIQQKKGLGNMEMKNSRTNLL